MQIQLYDRGSPGGKRMFADIKDICKRFQIMEDPEHIYDMHRPYSMGIQGKTILMINNQVALVDKFPSRSELEQIIADFLDETTY